VECFLKARVATTRFPSNNARPLVSHLLFFREVLLTYGLAGCWFLVFMEQEQRIAQLEKALIEAR